MASGLVAIGRRPEQGKGRPDIAGNSNDEGQVGAVDVRGLVSGFAEFDSEDLEPSGSEALAHPGKFLKSCRWSRRPTERKQHRPPLEHAAQRALDAVSLESEFGNWVRSGGDLTTELAHQDARGASADEVDRVRALTRGSAAAKPGIAPLARPRLTHRNRSAELWANRCGSVRLAGRIRRPAAAGPSPCPLKPWHETQFSYRERCRGRPKLPNKALPERTSWQNTRAPWGAPERGFRPRRKAACAPPRQPFAQRARKRRPSPPRQRTHRTGRRQSRGGLASSRRDVVTARSRKIEYRRLAGYATIAPRALPGGGFRAIGPKKSGIARVREPI
jgi:hypothetical protein